MGHNTTSPGDQPPGRAGGQRQTRGDVFGGDMANGPSSSSAGWKREPPQTAQSSTGSTSPSSSSCAADSGLAPIVRHSPSRVSIFIISAGPAHSGGVGVRRGLRELGRRRGEGTSIGSVCGNSVACGSEGAGLLAARAARAGEPNGFWPTGTFSMAFGAGMSIISRGREYSPAFRVDYCMVCNKMAKELDALDYRICWLASL